MSALTQQAQIERIARRRQLETNYRQVNTSLTSYLALPASNNSYRSKAPSLDTLSLVSRTNWTDLSSLPPKPHIRYRVVGRLSVSQAYTIAKHACHRIPYIDRSDMVQECMIELVIHHAKITTKARAYAYCNIRVKRYWQHAYSQSHEVAYAHARRDLLSSLPTDTALLAKRRLRGKTLDQVDQAKLSKYRRVVSWLFPPLVSLNSQVEDIDGNSTELGNTIADTLRFEHEIEFKSFLAMPRQVKRAAQDKLDGLRLTNHQKQLLSTYAKKIFG